MPAKKQLLERRRRTRRSSTVGGRRQGDAARTVQELITLIGDIAQQVPASSKTTPIHASVAALAHAADPASIRQELKRLSRAVDRAVAEDPLLQLEATVERLRLVLGDE